MENIFRNSAWLYDMDNRDNLTSDISFYIDYAREQNGAILELGCGTGRVALALAKERFHVTGLDLSIQMLDVFRSKLKKQPELEQSISLVHGNMANFHLGHKFKLIIAPFRAFQAITNDTDIVHSLSCIKEHLTDDGIFIVNVFNPYPAMDERWCYPEKVLWERLDEATGNYIVRKDFGDKIDPEKQIIYPHIVFEVTYQDGRKERIVDDLQLKYYYEEQLKTLLENAGFTVKESFGWYDKTSIEFAWREIIFVCGRK